MEHRQHADHRQRESDHGEHEPRHGDRHHLGAGVQLGRHLHIGTQSVAVTAAVLTPTVTSISPTSMTANG